MRRGALSQCGARRQAVTAATQPPLARSPDRHELLAAFEVVLLLPLPPRLWPLAVRCSLASRGGSPSSRGSPSSLWLARWCLHSRRWLASSALRDGGEQLVDDRRACLSRRRETALLALLRSTRRSSCLPAHGSGSRSRSAAREHTASVNRSGRERAREVRPSTACTASGGDVCVRQGTELKLSI